MRGYLTQINDIENCTSKDLFYMSLHYGTDGENATLGSSKYYNGNIGHILWRTGDDSCSDTPLGDILHKMY
jgi:hypothetical protein